MSTVDPDHQYRLGLSALAGGRPAVAAEHFKEAMELERRQGSIRPQMRYASYRGLSLALAHGASHEALALCERAAREDSFDAAMQHNLGRVYLMANKRTKALAAFERGLKLDPENGRLRTVLAKVDRRSPPPVRRLGRDHPLNRSLGRLFAALRPARRT